MHKLYVTTPARRKRHRQYSKSIKTRTNYMKFNQSAGKSVRASYDWFTSHCMKKWRDFCKPIMLYDTQMKTTLSINIIAVEAKYYWLESWLGTLLYSKTGATPWITSVCSYISHLVPRAFFPFRWTRDEKWSSCLCLRYCASENQIDQALRILNPIHPTAFLDDC